MSPPPPRRAQSSAPTASKVPRAPGPAWRMGRPGLWPHPRGAAGLRARSGISAGSGRNVAAAGTMPAPCAGPLRDGAGSSCLGTALLSRSQQEADGDDTGGRFLRQDARAFSTATPVAEPAGPGVHGQHCSSLQKPCTSPLLSPLPPSPALCRLLRPHHPRCGVCQVPLPNGQPALGCTLPTCQEPASCCPGAGAKPVGIRGRGTSAAVPRLCPARCRGGGGGRARGRTRLPLEGSSPSELTLERRARGTAEPSRSSASRDAAARQQQQQPPPGRAARSYVRDSRLGVSTQRGPAKPCTTEVYLERTVSQ